MTPTEIWWLGVTAIATVALAPWVFALIAGLATVKIRDDEEAAIIMYQWSNVGNWVGIIAAIITVTLVILLH